MNGTYPEPVSKLLTYGKAEATQDWPDYLDLGLAQEHIPDLIRMATDPELNEADSDSLEVWAPVHAWRALGQLRAEAAIHPLMGLFETQEDNEWVIEELPDVYGMIGPPAIPPLADYLSDLSHSMWGRIRAASCLERIGILCPAVRDECVSVLTQELRRSEANDPELGGFLVSDLIDLKAVESISVIREAFANDRVDRFIVGDLEDVEIALGLRAPALTVPRAQRKIGRNEPCPCGSGKKYKKCCLGT